MAVKAAKSVRNTYLYITMNKGSYLDNNLKALISKGKVLKPADLQYEVSTINKYYKFSMKKSVMDAYEKGLIKPIVLPVGTKEKASASVPFLLYGNGGVIGAYAFIDNYVQYAKASDTYSIDPRKLYCLLESAYIAILIQKNHAIFARSAVLASEGASVFAHTFIRVLNRKYALNIDRRAYGKVLFLAAKFFMINHLDMDPTSESVFNYAVKVSEVDSPLSVRELDVRFDEAKAYTNINEFINFLRTNSYMINQGLAELTMRDYLTDYVNLYQSTSIFALEHFSYFMFMIDSVILGAYLNNQAILEDIIGKSGAKIYTQIAQYQE
jgi:hypothetical protein